jgi:hypothetical protein
VALAGEDGFLDHNRTGSFSRRILVSVAAIVRPNSRAIYSTVALARAMRRGVATSSFQASPIREGMLGCVAGAPESHQRMTRGYKTAPTIADRQNLRQARRLLLPVPRRSLRRPRRAIRAAAAPARQSHRRLIARGIYPGSFCMASS